MSKEKSKIRDAVASFDKIIVNEDEDAMTRIEALQYFKNEISPIVNWIDKYMKYNEELRDMFIGAEIKKQLSNVLTKAESNTKELDRLQKEVRTLSKALIETQQEADNYFDDLSNYYDMYWNMTFKDWIKVQYRRIFKRSHNK